MHHPRPRVQIVATVATWMMWACVWMHQWNPIILPTRGNLHGVQIFGDVAAGGAGHEGGAAGGH